MQTTAIQQALQQRGYALGPAGVDGVWGRASQAALKSFQHLNSLPETGVPDSATLAALCGTVCVPPTAPAVDPVWYTEAARLKGVHEVEGPGSNPVILGWAKVLSAWVGSVYKDDATPWCGLFVGHCIAATLPGEVLPSNPLSALAWAAFGRKTAPALGAVLVFKRTGGGHVGFYAGEDADAFHVLGGNQSDQVDVTRVAKARLVAFRWPASVEPPTGGRVSAAATSPLSRNEA